MSLEDIRASSKLAKVRPIIPFDPFRIAPQYLIRNPDEHLNHRVVHGLSEILRNRDRGFIDEESFKILRKQFAIGLFSREGRRIINEEIDANYYMDINGRRVGALLEYNIRGNSKAAELIKRSRRRLENSEHGARHTTRFTKLGEGAIHQTPALRHEASVIAHYYPFLLTAVNHDQVQLMWLDLNREEGRSGQDEYVAKEGHGPGGAALMLIFEDNAVKVGKFSDDPAEAKTIARKLHMEAAVMSIRHDEMKSYDQAMRWGDGKEKAYSGAQPGAKVPLEAKRLVELFEGDNLDFFSMAPRDVLIITRETNLRNGFVQNPDDPYDLGLPPDFQNDPIYRAKIIELLNDYDRPLDNADDNERLAIRRTGELANWADTQEKNMPPNESLLRTLYTQYSRFRPFFVDMSAEEIVHALQEWNGRPTSEYNFDSMRMWWELLHQDDPIQDPALKESKYMHDLSRDASMMRALALRQLGYHIMTGNLDYIKTLYQRRYLRLIGKDIEKAGYSQAVVEANVNNLEILVSQGYDLLGDPQEFERLAGLIAELDPVLAEKFMAQRDFFIFEADDIIKSILLKPDRAGDPQKEYDGTNSPAVYPTEAIEKFDYISRYVIGQLAIKNELGSVDEIENWINNPEADMPEAIAYYSEQLNQGHYPRLTPYRAFDESGTSSKRTLFPLDTLVESN